MAGIRDPWANDHLLPPPPPNFENLTTEQQYDYFRACGILPPLHPPADAAVVPTPGYYADGPFLGTMEDRDVKPFAAFFAAQRVLAAEEEQAAPFHDAPAATFWDAMDDYDVKPPSASGDVHAAAAFQAHQFLPFGAAVAPPPAAAPFPEHFALGNAAGFWPSAMDYYDVKPPSTSHYVHADASFEDPFLQFLAEAHATPFPVPVAPAYPAAGVTFWDGAMDDYDVKPTSTSNVVQGVAFEAQFMQYLAGVHGAAAPFPAPFAPAYPAAAVKEEAVAPTYIDASHWGMIKKEEQRVE